MDGRTTPIVLTRDTRSQLVNLHNLQFFMPSSTSPFNQNFPPQCNLKTRYALLILTIQFVTLLSNPPLKFITCLNLILLRLSIV